MLTMAIPAFALDKANPCPPGWKPTKMREVTKSETGGVVRAEIGGKIGIVPTVGGKAGAGYNVKKTKTVELECVYKP
jgi:hypothetical protein